VRRRVGDVEEERSLGRILVMLANELRCVIGDRVGIVEALRGVLGIGERGDHRVPSRERGWIIIASRALNRPVVAIEPALKGPVSLVAIGLLVTIEDDAPLADRAGAIARGTERLRDRHAALVERASIPRVTTILDHVADARLVHTGGA